MSSSIYVQKDCAQFIVKNISLQKKRINIFQYPINLNEQRDLLSIPGITEDKIRGSLLKGEVQFRFLAKDIELVYSNIDILQFDKYQKDWLLNLGFDIGLHIGISELASDTIDFITSSGNSGGSGGSTGGSNGNISSSQHKAIRQLIHLADGVGGPYEGFPTNAYREITPLIFPTSIIWWSSPAKVAKYVEKTITFNLNKTPSIIEWKAYGTDGVTILATVLDTITYSGIFELYRVRNIIDTFSISEDLTIEIHKYVRQLIHLADGVGGPFEGFASGAYRETLPAASMFPTSIIWYNDVIKTLKIVEKTIIYNVNKTVSLISWKVYDTDGITVLTTVLDTPVYTGIFENNRVRSII